MKRILEPELMNDQGQAKAYADADFETQHSTIIQLIDEVFDGIDIVGEILDLGCGPGNLTFRIARRFPNARVTGVDGSKAMIDFAEECKDRDTEFGNRVEFVQATIPSADIPKKKYDLIVSTNFLHHLHQPCLLWQTIDEYSKPDTQVFIVDLIRPEDKSAAKWIVNEFSNNKSDRLKEDFYNSLLAAFTPEEIGEQLIKAGLGNLSIYNDRYICVYGEVG